MIDLNSGDKRFFTSPNTDAANYITVKYTHFGEYFYFGSFLVSLGQRAAPTNDRSCFISRMWANDELIYDRRAGWYKPGLDFKFFPGTEDQEEVKNGFHYRGLMCVYFNNFQLTDYGDGLPAISAEIVDGADTVNEVGNYYGVSADPVFALEMDFTNDRILQLQHYIKDIVGQSAVLQTIRLSTKAKTASTVVPSLSRNVSNPWYGSNIMFDLAQRCVGFLGAQNLVLTQDNTFGITTDKYLINAATGERLGILSSAAFAMPWNMSLGFQVSGNGRTESYFLGWKAGDPTNGKRLGFVYVKNGAPISAGILPVGFFPDYIVTVSRGPAIDGQARLLVVLAGAVWLLKVGPGELPTISGAALYTPGAGYCYNAYTDPRDGTAIIVVRSGIGDDGYAVKVDMAGTVVWTSATFTVPSLTGAKGLMACATSNLLGGTLALARPGTVGGISMLNLDTGAVAEDLVAGPVIPGTQTPVIWDSQSRTLYTDTRTYVKIESPIDGPLNVGDVLRQFSIRVGYDNADIFTENMDDMPIDGYVLSGTSDLASIANGLAQLYGFDWVERSDQVIFKFTYDPEGELLVDAVAGPERLAELTETKDGGPVNNVERSSDDPFPHEMSVSYFNKNRNYEAGNQSAKRSSFPFATQSSVNKANMSLPIVLDDSTAKSLIIAALYRAWGSKVGYSIRLPAEFVGLDPSDVLTFTADGFQYSAQLTQMTINADNSISVSLSEVAAAQYPVSVPAQGSMTQIAIPPGTPINCILIDAPSLYPEADILGQLNLICLMGGYNDSSFGGGRLEIAGQDDPTSFVGAVSVTREQEALIGFIDTEMADIADGFTIDDVTVIRVARGNIPLSRFVAATDAEMLAGANLVVIGQNNTPEYIAFGVVNIIDAHTVEVSHLMRGRYGTEINMNTHATGDFFAFLDNAQIVGYSINLQNTSLFFRALGNGQPTWQADTQMLTVSGASRKPYAPVGVKAHREDSGDITFTWVRRARFFNSPAEDFLTLDPPLDENLEGYEVEVYSDDWTVLTRRITEGIDGQSWVYTITAQLEDSTNEQEEYNFLVYQKNQTHVPRGFPGGGTIPTDDGKFHGIVEAGGDFVGHLMVAANLAGLIAGEGVLSGDIDAADPQYLAGTITDDSTVVGDLTILGANDPYFSQVKILLHFEGTNGQTTTVDSSASARTLIRRGAVDLDTSKSDSGSASSSKHYNNTNNFWDVAASTDLGLSNSAPWTVEVSTNFTAVQQAAIMGVWFDTVPGCSWYLYNVSSNVLRFTYYNASGNQSLDYAWTYSTNTWYKLAVDFDGTSLRMYVDGVMVAKSTITGVMQNSGAAPFEVGKIYGIGSYQMPGNIDEVRITKGTARYASDAGYTPSTTPFPDS